MFLYKASIMCHLSSMLPTSEMNFPFIFRKVKNKASDDQLSERSFGDGMKKQEKTKVPVTWHVNISSHLKIFDQPISWPELINSGQVHYG